MKKKLLSMVMAMSMVFAMAPMGVLADDVIDTEDELIAALAAGGEVTLGGDINLTEQIDVNVDTTLDLNGHTIALSAVISTDAWSIGNIYVGRDTACDMVVKDTVGGGAIVQDESDGSIALENGTLTVESGNICNIFVWNGTLNLNGGTIDYINAGSSVIGTSTICKETDAVVNEWDIFIATFNFDPTDYLHTGYGVTDNGDGTYTTKYVVVEETGETYTFYFYDWLEAYGCYHVGGETMQDQLRVYP